jgi:hypothetical protein
MTPVLQVVAKHVPACCRTQEDNPVFAPFSGFDVDHTFAKINMLTVKTDNLGEPQPCIQEKSYKRCFTMILGGIQKLFELLWRKYPAYGLVDFGWLGS